MKSNRNPENPFPRILVVSITMPISVGELEIVKWPAIAMLIGEIK